MILRDLCNYFKAKQEQIPDVQDFIFGVDESALRDYVARFAGYYMFVDYGSFSSTTDSNNRINDRIECAVTIAHPIGANPMGIDELNEVAFRCFELVSDLRRAMVREKIECPWLRYLSLNHEILPFVAPDISRSIGSTLTFNIEGKDILGVKER